MQKFSIYNLTLPGQEPHSSDLPGLTYPSLEQLAGLLLSVLHHYNINTMVGLGVGIGANILLRHGCILEMHTFFSTFYFH